MKYKTGDKTIIMSEKYENGPIFLNSKSKEEWDNADPSLKKYVEQNISEMCKKLENSMAIETLACILSELIERVEKLEKKTGDKNGLG